MPTKIIESPIDKLELSDLELKGRYGGLVKAVVDIEKKVMMAGTTMHADAEEFLLENGSQQKDLW